MFDGYEYSRLYSPNLETRSNIPRARQSERKRVTGAMRLKRGRLDAVTRFQGAVDVLDHRIDGGDTPGRICPAPAIRAKAGPSLPFRLFPEVLDGSVDHRDTGAFGDRMP